MSQAKIVYQGSIITPRKNKVTKKVTPTYVDRTIGSKTVKKATSRMTKSIGRPVGLKWN